jgi:hypothetical protein
MTTIVTRFAPSPTGLLHAGNYRTAVFSYLYARQRGGKFVLRIEDTDRERSKKEYADNIIESLNWLGLDYDNVDAVPHQSERSDLYKKYLQKLIDEDRAYYSKEEVKNFTNAISHGTPDLFRLIFPLDANPIEKTHIIFRLIFPNPALMSGTDHPISKLNLLILYLKRWWRLLKKFEL